MIVDQFGRPVGSPRLFGFVPPQLTALELTMLEPVADAIASAAIYPDEEVQDL